MRERLISEYRKKEGEIKARLSQFGASSIFEELCFCLCTPQSKARSCDRAVKRLFEEGLLPNGNIGKIARVLKKEGVRFHNNKAKFILEAAGMLPAIRKEIKGSTSNSELRNWLVDNIIGLGYKEASHFLRNIGEGAGLAILDRHILKNLLALGVIRDIPSSISKNKYLELEGNMSWFAKDVGIPMDELDLLLWSLETGEVFK